MAFPTYPYGYQPQYYPQPVPDQLAQLRQQQMQQPMMQVPQQMPVQQPASNSIIWVQGEEGAKAYMVAAGNSVLLMDSENSAFYIKSTDASGVPLPLRAFDYTERTAAPKTGASVPQAQDVEYVTRKEFNALQEKMEAFLAAPAASNHSRKKKEETDDGELTV